jgi:histidine ammonia-lyase
MTEPLAIDGESLTLDRFVAVAREGRAVALAPSARTRARASRARVERLVEQGRAVYGITTGFGRLSETTIPAERARALQRSLLRSHASGTGPPLSRELVRGMMIARANALARGLSGVRTELIEALLALLNRDLVPFVPEQGSVGASGDLAPLAHIGLALIGEGAFVDSRGTIRPAAEALRSASLDPVDLAEKEGVALINGTSLMLSYLAFGVIDVRSLLRAAEIAAAMSFDALRGNPDCLDDRLHAARGLEEQRAAAAALRELLAGSGLAVSGGEWRGQDPYTLRCAPQVFAATRVALGVAERLATTELNAVSDNPLVFEDDVLSGGNFHGQPLAFGLDALALGVHYVGAFAERRVALLVNPSLNRGLPAFLAADPGVESGFMIPQYVAAALVNENVSLVHPASAASLPTSADQEDFNSMGAWAGAKLARLLDNVRRIVAIEWIVAGRALELRRPSSGGRGSEAALGALRELVEPWTADRPPAPDVARVADALADGAWIRRVTTGPRSTR